MKNKNKINKKNLGILIGIIVLIIVIIILCFSRIFKSVTKPKIKLNFSDRTDLLEKVDELDVYKYGWLQVQGTNVDVPILTTTETNGEYGFGWISSNSVGMKTRKVLLGHNVLNVSSSPMVNNSILTDFEDLMSFVYYDFAKENMYISFLENGEAKVYVIYAIGFYDYGYDRSEGLNTKKEIKEYISKAKENSIYKYDVNVTEDDNILTVKTCTRYFGDSEKEQFVIDARELRKNETPVKYNVKKTKLYKQYKLVDSYKKNNEI